MKRFFNYLLLAYLLLLSYSGFSQTAGTLTISFNQPIPTSPSGTKNAIAVWIEDGTGTFIKTKMRYWGGGTNDHLPTWVTKSGQSGLSTIVDASTGATRSATTTPTAFGSKTVTWDGKSSDGITNGPIVTDGTYKVWIESSWQNSLAPDTHNDLISFSFTKGSVVDHQTPAGDTYFNTIVLDWVPAAAAPVASFSSSATSICQNSSITFTDLSTNSPTSWVWDFGDGQTSNAQNPPAHTYTTAGTFTVALTATNGSGSNTSTLANYITVSPTVVPSVSFFSNPTSSVCPGTTVQMTATPVNGGNPSYVWYLDGNLAGTSQTYSVVPTNGQTVSCFMTSDANCASPTTVNSSIYTASVYSVASVVISQTTGTLNSDASFGNQWYEQSIGLIAGENGQSFIPSADGNYYSVVTDVNGCTSTSNIINFLYVSVSNTNLNNAIIIYPNPVNDFVIIESGNNTKQLEISLVDMQGRVIETIKSTSEKSLLKMSDVSTGIYFVKVISENNTEMFKIVKH